MRIIFYIIALLVVLVDQISKYFIRTYVNIDEYVTFLGIQMTHIENSGMAGSLLQGYARIFGIAAVLFIAGVLYYRKTGVLKGWINVLSFGFLVGGAAGNGIDRILFGQVTDFLVSRSRNGVLNLADHAIEIGMLLLVVSAVFRTLHNWRMRRASSKFIA
ncbi:MAG: signal peptidase II [Paenibacillaceae bacterium]